MATREQGRFLLDDLLREGSDVPEALREVFVRDRRGFEQMYLWSVRYLARMQRLRLAAEDGGPDGDPDEDPTDALEAALRAEWDADRAGFDAQQEEVVLMILTAESIRQTGGKTDET